MTDVLKIVNWFRVKNNSDKREAPELIDSLTQLKVMKLLYYVQGVYLAIYDERAFPDDIVAWKYGPAVERVHSKYNGCVSIVDNNNAITKNDVEDYKLVENNEKLSQVVNAVESTYGDMSAIELMKQTHNESPWKETSQSSAIQDDLIKKYFKEKVVSK